MTLEETHYFGCRGKPEMNCNHFAVPAFSLCLIVLNLGCLSSPTPHESTANMLREQWSKSQAYETGKLLGEAYDAYQAKRKTDPRGPEFEILASMLQFFESKVSGEQCLDYLGQPDLWQIGADGDARFVYFFRSGSARLEAYIQISAADNRIKVVGWNNADVNDYRNSAWHR